MTNSETAGPEARLFPSAITPTTADAIAAYQFHTGRLAERGYGEALAVLHARSLDSDPALAALFRSPEAVDDVGVAAMHVVPNVAALQEQAAATARDRYKRAIAQQLVSSGHALAKPAKAYLVECDARDRAEAARVAAVEAERRAAEQAESDRRAAQLAERAKLAAAAREAMAGLETVSWQHDEAQRSAKLVLAEAVIARLSSSGLTELRIGSRGLFGVDDLLAKARDLGADMLKAISGALDRHEETAQ